MAGALFIPPMEFHKNFEAPPLKVLVIGHTFVANVERYFLLRTWQGDAMNVDNGVSWQELNAKWMGVNVSYKELHFEYLPCILMDTDDGVETIEQLRPNVVILELLGDGITDEADPVDTAEMFDFAWCIKSKYRVQAVNLFTSIRPSRGIMCTQAEFDVRRTANDVICTRCVLQFNLDVHEVRGFSRYGNGQVIDVNYYSMDGIVLDPEFDSFGFQIDWVGV